MKVDLDQMATEATSEEVMPSMLPADNDKSADLEHVGREIAPTFSNDFDQFPRDKSIGFCITAVAFSVAIFSQCLLWICEVGLSAAASIVASAASKAAVCQEPSPLHARTKELRNIAAGLAQQDSSFAPDSLVMLGLGAFVLLAVLVMQIDMDEMANDATSEEGQLCKVLEDVDNLAVNKHVEGEVAPTSLIELDK